MHNLHLALHINRIHNPHVVAREQFLLEQHGRVVPLHSVADLVDVVGCGFRFGFGVGVIRVGGGEKGEGELVPAVVPVEAEVDVGGGVALSRGLVRGGGMG